MAGAVMNPQQATGSVDMPAGRTPSTSYVNTFRISAAVDRLLAHVRGGSRNDNNEFCRLCLSLSRGIDYAVGNNEIPDRASELPYLLKQVCQWTNDTHLLTAIMVLMISMKGACKNGWFNEKDNDELHILWNEIATSFCSARDMNSGDNTVHNSISTVMSRFYPRMKMGEVLAFIEAKPGYGAYVKDFHIPKNAKSPDDKVYLFVAQTDNTETSSCIINPQLVNFLLNGKAVDRRTCVYKDPGPQIPSVVSNLVKYGTNLLQAVGQFNGKYFIVVAFMSLISNPSCPVLPDYMPPVTAASDSDNDIIEGPSRISLNCPISFKRITTPVKGNSCKHLQCFDFDNYVDINSRRPSWRCPHCSQSVSFTDIRIDQGMVKVLKEVGENISHVKISADGSWEGVIECDDHADKQEYKPPLHRESTPSLDMRGDIMDLTEGDNNDMELNAGNSHQENEKKPSPTQLQDQPNPNDQIPTHVNMNNVHTNVWRPTRENGTSNTRFNVTMMPPVTDTFPNAVSHGQINSMQLPTHAIGTSNTFLNPISQCQSQIPGSSDMQFQHNSTNSMSNDSSGRYTTHARHVTRVPIAVQALPAQTPAGMVSSDNIQQRFSRFQMDQHQLMRMISASMSQNTGSQNWVHHDRSNLSNQPVQQFGARSGPLHQSSGYQFNSHQHQNLNHMIPNLVQSPAQLSPQFHQGFVGPTTGHVGNQQAHHYAGPTTSPRSNQQPHQYVGPTTSPVSNKQAHHYANAAAQQTILITSWTPPVPAPLQTSGSPMPVMTSSDEQRGLGQGFRVMEGSADAPAVDQNWRPTGRMRGSLSGQAYKDAFNQYIVHPTQPVQAASPLVWNTPRPVIPPHLQALMANNINANGFQEGSDGSVVDGGSGGGGAGVLSDN